MSASANKVEENLTRLDADGIDYIVEAALTVAEHAREVADTARKLRTDKRSHLSLVPDSEPVMLPAAGAELAWEGGADENDAARAQVGAGHYQIDPMGGYYAVSYTPNDGQEEDDWEDIGEAQLTQEEARLLCLARAKEMAEADWVKRQASPLAPSAAADDTAASIVPPPADGLDIPATLRRRTSHATDIARSSMTQAQKFDELRKRRTAESSESEDLADEPEAHPTLQ